MPETLTVGELAERIGATLNGDPKRELTGAAPLDSAGPSDLTFLASRKYLPYVAGTRAAAVIVGDDLGDVEDVPEGTAVLRVEDAHAALAAALPLLYPPDTRPTGIAPTAVIADGVSLGEGVSVGPNAVIGANATLADDVRIGALSSVGAGCRIGAGTEIKENVTLYPGTVVGEGCTIHSGARLGVDGYGYVFRDGRHQKVPQVGRCVIEDDVEIGANTTIDRGSVGETRIGAGTKIDNLVHIAHNVRVGRNCLIVAQVGIAGSSRLGDGVALAGQVGVIGHLTIGDGAQVAAQSGVGQDIPAGETWFGSPARPRTQALRANAAVLKLPDLVRRVRKMERTLEGEEA